ncbi:ATP-dependent zinc metalloprotease FtsH [compost metagenome]
MKANLVLALVRSQVENDAETFKRITLQIAAHEATAGHVRIATELRELIDNIQFQSTQGQYVGKPEPAIPITRPNGELSSLLHASYPKERLSNMVLDSETKRLLKRTLDEQHHRAQFASFGLVPRKKFLLVGPPGCGKTMTAKMLAGELSRPLFVVGLEGLLSRYLGETSVHLNAIFESMKKVSGVYLFDEFDSIGTYRGDARDIGEVRRVLSTFLQLIENDESDSIVVAATNYEHVLDDALFRRFDDVIEFSLPSATLIEDFLKKTLQLVSGKVKYPWKEVTKLCEGLSFAEIERACMDAIKCMIMDGDSELSVDLLQLSLQERTSIKKRMNNVRRDTGEKHEQ